MINHSHKLIAAISSHKILVRDLSRFLFLISPNNHADSFDIIELPKNNYKPEAHAMNKSITQATQNDKQISKSIKRFFTRFHISSALKAANAYKRKGTPVTEIFQYMFLLIFSNRSMYMSLLTGKDAFYYNPCIQNHK